MKNILLLADYRSQFWLKTDYKEQSIDLKQLRNEIVCHGYNVEIRMYAEINFRTDNFRDWFVFYQSSQDPGLLYKSFIEDVLLGLKLQGAHLLPDYIYLRAHHNKVFMEILRETCGTSNIKLLKSFYFGTYEEFRKNKQLNANHKYVFKLSTGDQSKNVKLLNSKTQFLNIPKKLSQSINFYYWLVDQIKPCWKSRYPNYRRKSHHRNKFIIQEFIPNLTGDYKVLVFTDKKMFVLVRETRLGDFTASGSGRFNFSREIPEGLLDFSLEVFNSFSVPFISLDIALADGKYYLLEFQFVHFGTYTAEKSSFHFERNLDVWEIIEERVVIEREYAIALDWFIQIKYSTH